jgi:hypothetical protein
MNENKSQLGKRIPTSRPTEKKPLSSKQQQQPPPPPPPQQQQQQDNNKQKPASATARKSTIATITSLIESKYKNEWNIN